MKLYVEGEKGKALCEDDGRVSTTFRYRDVPFSDGSGVARRILAGVCDSCGKVVSIPPQSTPSIRAARKSVPVSIETMLPAVYLDALDLACYRIDPDGSPDFRKRLVMYYLHNSSLNKTGIRRLAKATLEGRKGFKASTSEKKRLSMKVSEPMSSTITRLSKTMKLSKTDLIKGAIARIRDDIVTPEHPAHFEELKTLAMIAKC